MAVANREGGLITFLPDMDALPAIYDTPRTDDFHLAVVVYVVRGGLEGAKTPVDVSALPRSAVVHAGILDELSIVVVRCAPSPLLHLR